MEYIAHIRESDKKIQSVEEHLLGVKSLSELFGDKIGVRHIAGLAGVLHDMGKFTVEFREYIVEATRNPDSPPRRGSVDHSTAGGKLLYDLLHTGTPSNLSWILSEIVGNSIISHHSYLHDFLNPDLESPYLRRVQKTEPELKEFERSKRCFFSYVMSEEDFQQYVSKATDELEAYLMKPFAGNTENKLMFLTKFIFSVLIDADRTNTRLFEEDKINEIQQEGKVLFKAYYERLISKLQSYQDDEGTNKQIQTLRREMSEQCDRFASRPSGIYTLSIPTGGGKTFASLRYALRHASQYGKKHIIYVVPYTTIIEQNAEEVRKVLLDDEHILEHHSNVVYDLDDDDELEDGIITTRQKLKLARDAWDSPIIFTTMVQFLNVFYAKGSRNIRRLHNLSESVLIFDEVQKVPTSCVSLFNQALNFLKTYGRSSIILCTATQPALNFVEHKLETNTDAEIIENLNHVIEAFKRVEIVDKASDEMFDNDKLADFVLTKIDEVQSVLVVLNTKSVVKRLYRRMDERNVPTYHLSTSMCAVHRIDILQRVREHLRNHDKVVCISTQLIEAGVDVSFDCVIRSLAGLDSIAQASGRCNRNGEERVRQVYLIDHKEENLDHLQEIKVGKKLTKQILLDLKRNKTYHGGNILSSQALKRYFQEFYTKFQSSLNYYVPKLDKEMIDILASARKYNSYRVAYTQNKKQDLPLFVVNSYRTAAENFRVFEDNTTSVIVPYDEKGKDIIRELNGSETIKDLSRLLREAQRYSVGLFDWERDQLLKNHGLIRVLDGKIMVLKESAYSKEYGLDLDNDSQFDEYFF